MALCHIAFNGNNPTRPSQPYPSQGWGGTSQALPITRNQHQDHLDLNIFATMQTSPDYLGLAYGCLVAMGGIMGFVKASSVPSLVAGTVSGKPVSTFQTCRSRSGNFFSNLHLNSVRSISLVS
ncbi:hypothetical protein Pst134EA_030564 [Puccinia striiformis f. sp. tritici]|uniref:hypothetical protein n=1 Tax=Puccinia striiformis f. sp. tritici TaxID=168172 RepID=UPI00200836E7|nr:hypothetical protein Pst134EA_030564 [Puccinia striiformis f. sp. tritici]KAH9446654.1 hypothetical protein Pst134EA_030564 [Puccinia striiformis f. sp. tritici]